MVQYLRFPVKLTFAILLALMLGFYCNLETPRWAVMTAGIVAGGQAFAAGGDPYSGALRHRGVLRIIGTFIGCIAALTIMIFTAQAPVVMLMLCCAWAGLCVWQSSLIRAENSYALGLAGYTTLIIVVTVNASGTLQLVPRFAVERCCEIIIGIVCAILADMIFSPRSIKKVIDQEVESLLLSQYQLLQSGVRHNSKEELDKAWSTLVRRTSAFSGMRSQLRMESSHWQNASRRMKMLHTLSLTMITQAAETFLIQNTRENYIPASFRELIGQDVSNIVDLRKQLKELRRLLTLNTNADIPVTLSSWIGAASEYLLLMKGIQTNARINKIEETILQREGEVHVRSAETHPAMINGIRTFVATALGSLFWLYSGWNAGSACMVMLAVVTSLAMRLPNPLMLAKDFLYGMSVAVPLGALYYVFLMPGTQQSLFLLCLIIGALAFVSGIFIQRRQLGTLGAFIGTLNIIVLSNPMSFGINTFLDNALGQVIGCFLAMLVILLIRDKSKGRTGRKILNRFMYAAVSALTTNPDRRRENHLPSLYQQLFLLLNLFPGDINKYRLALTLIISHQRLRQANIPCQEELSEFHRRLRYTGDRIISSHGEEKKRYYYQRLLQEFDIYQQKLQQYAAPLSVTEPVRRLVDILTRYQNTLINI
ncbi:MULTISPECIES: p-hydroxybenzoic acid efflux pump subunit AaeB [unclassified Tatumella]|uniref:p-hydroxybenzoic acid efflux pump subunit AaeB n=1 Tax=unclassified Tatumella TaxID=2649542 RepID=UPI001BAEF374|nr:MULTISPECIES: p-hydroxybenzoic acid efflux pump subunit AaeB [unclassified Tatumella]MBS0857377.1 p-hydroxybenzoic acid efflux pump subunit AaeB [Tatumella sp. JGM16]MBS0893409.1 p-hydroxybenzoic acid efflux pump subunit AaeB [Tatumella sp. JGM130]MBS0912609.1 p-hydroxybenzoic acid efflux pump subunit AaeB [Tatumella sp. JGM91]